MTRKKTTKRKKKPPLGSGKRFDTLTRQLKKKGVDNPAAVAAYIGRRKSVSDKI